MFDWKADRIESGELCAVCEILRRGGIVALPTETVYGLAANALDERAVAKIFAAKGRPQDNPLIVHISDLAMIEELVTAFPEGARRLAGHFWPGPLTMVLPKSDKIPAATSAGLDTVGIRMPSGEIIRRVIEESGLPLAAPSANRSGRPSTTSARHCIEDLWGRVDAIVDGGECEVGVESTVVSLAGATPRLLRPGAVTYEQLCAVLGEVEMDQAVRGQADPESRVSAPGMKYRHYAPKAKVRLLLGGGKEFSDYVNARAGEGTYALCFAGEEGALSVPAIVLGKESEPLTIAHRLFSALRELDEKGAGTVFAHCPAPQGVGLAVYNRMVRAAAFDVIKL
ncbi:MAG: threonylcarbamoyl-AMP synthase [Clostridiales bacterium]|nr:MAG: threonylcarbamoyl-AMP synthase [Clostridiales bacterium]